MAAVGDIQGNGISLERIRVLVVSQDHRFLALAHFLLSRKGLTVESTSSLSRVLKLIVKDVDVVVVDESDSLASAALTVAAIDVLHSNVKVIVVSEEPQARGSLLRPLPKWGVVRELVDEIERAYLRLDPPKRPVQSGLG
jgi:hypothetical protein